MNMTKERKRINTQLNIEHQFSPSGPFTLSDAFLHLKKCHGLFNPKYAYFEFLIYGKITPAEIKNLLELPYEIALTEQDNNIILTTGKEHHVGIEEDFLQRRDKSKLFFHTHPIKNRKVPVTTPSFSDVYIIDFISKDTLLSLAHEEGIIIYRAPTRDPTTNKRWKGGDVRNLLVRYGKKTEVDIFGFSKNSNKKVFFDMSEEEKVEYQRKFVEASGMIVNEAKWQDKQNIKKIVKKIFSGLNQ